MSHLRPALVGDEWGLEEMPNGNLEFSLVRTPIAGHIIVPAVRDQGEDITCVFESVLGTAESDVFRDLAQTQNRTNNIRFNTPSFVASYESDIGMSIEEEQRLKRIHTYREETALSLFEREGVMASSDDWEYEKPVRLDSYRKLRQQMFARVAKYIQKGRCLMGSMPVGPTLATLGPNDIYRFYKQGPLTDDQPEPLAGHAVVFVGYGLEDGLLGEPFLVFMNSGGPHYADGGFGRVYFSDVYSELYILTVERMVQPPDDDSEGEAVVAALQAAWDNVCEDEED